MMPRFLRHDGQFGSMNLRWHVEVYIKRRRTYKDKLTTSVHHFD